MASIFNDSSLPSHETGDFKAIMSWFHLLGKFSLISCPLLGSPLFMGSIESRWIKPWGRLQRQVENTQVVLFGKEKILGTLVSLSK